MGFHFRRRYSLSPADPRYLACTEAEILVDYWAHRHFDDPKLADELVNEDFESDLADFERQIAAGEPAIPATPDPGDWEEVASGLPTGITL